jgi:hypothetical protein
MKRVWQITQNLVSTISASFFVIINLMQGWGTFEAQRLGVPVLIVYNTFDIFIGQYWKYDRLLLLHHLAVIAFGSYIWYLDGFDDLLYRISFWFSIGELSSILNSVRWFFYNTEWEKQSKMAFAIAFLFVRPISNIGLLNVVSDFRNQLIIWENQPDIYDGYYFGYKMLLLSSAIYTGLNMFWGSLIMKKITHHIVE